jgi:hypothetical protein
MPATLVMSLMMVSPTVYQLSLRHSIDKAVLDLDPAGLLNYSAV